jgi:hypothetical protein
MAKRLSWTRMAGIALVSAGCSESPLQTAADLGVGSPSQAGTERTFGLLATLPLIPDDKHQGWAKPYPWRGPGAAPTWYGKVPYASNSYVHVGAYYYPYYIVDGKLYAVYSMPYTLTGTKLTPYYSAYLPVFGPYAVPAASARLLKYPIGTAAPPVTPPKPAPSPSAKPTTSAPTVPGAIADDKHQGWGKHYPWRGPAPTPSWYGVQPHAANSFVRVGDYYYPYYVVETTLYPVYSMPRTLQGNTYVPHYSAYLPTFGPYAMPMAAADLFPHRSNQRP